MRALIFADRDSRCLAPLDRSYAMATLPLAGKELILYTVEDLVRSGVTEIVFVVADHADRIERLLGDGRRWGARFRFVLGRGSERPSQVWTRVRIGKDQPLLVLRGDLLRSPAVAELMTAAQGIAGTQLYGLGSDPRGSVLLLRPGHENPSTLIDLLHLDEPASPLADGCLELPGVEVRLLDTLSGYHRACLDLVSGRINGLESGGRELALGLSVGLQSRVSPRSLKQGRAYVGDNSRVHPEAELLGNVMIARDVVIDRAAMLYDCVILPHSYVGEMLEVNDAIVCGDTLMRVDTGVVLTISDAFLLGRLGSSQFGSPRPSGARLTDRLVGVLLLILSLPLWPLALVAAALQSGGSGAASGGMGRYVGESGPAGDASASSDSTVPDAAGSRSLERGVDGARNGTVDVRQRSSRLVTDELLIGNRHTVVAVGGVAGAFLGWRFNTRIPVLARLPRLLAVVRGDLRIVGVSALSPAESHSRTEDWQRVRDQAPVGLIGPTQLMLASDTPLDERLMSDAFYVGQRDWLKDFRLCGDAFRTLFSAHAWIGRPA